MDLYAGSGGLSIEAVSRGMSHAVLVERDRKAQAIIAENIQMTKEVSKFQLLKMEAERALEQVNGPFDLVFFRPSLCQGTNRCRYRENGRKKPFLRRGHGCL